MSAWESIGANYTRRRRVLYLAVMLEVVAAFLESAGFSGESAVESLLAAGALLIALLFFLLWRVSRRAGGVGEKIEQIAEHLENSLSDQIRELHRSVESEMEKRIGNQTNQIAVMADSWRSTLADSMTRIVKELGAFQTEEQRMLAGHHEKTLKELASHEQTITAHHQKSMKEFSDHAIYVHDRLTQHGGESAQSFRQVREELLSQATAHAREERELVRQALDDAAKRLSESVNKLSAGVDSQMTRISEKVSERLERSFQETNKTFQNVLQRLASINEAQKKIEELTGDVVSLNQLLSDKRTRGAYGEAQLEHLVGNLLSVEHYEFQHSLPNGEKADCLLKLPEPTGNVPIDSKCPLENYSRMFDANSTPESRNAAKAQFKSDIRGHIKAIADRLILPPHTADGAVMFIPAEAVFAEIHSSHRDIVDEAIRRRVWLVSPTTMMAILNTARAVIRDLATRQQAERIRADLDYLRQEFLRFDLRMEKLAKHIEQASEDVQQVRKTSRKISGRFREINQASGQFPKLENDDDDKSQ